MAKPDLRDNRKFLKLRRLLGEPTPHVIGYLECLWNRGYQTGNPVIGDELDVEAAAEYPGEPKKFAEACFQSGFLDRTESGEYQIHQLYEHAPKYAKARMARLGFGPKSKVGKSPKKDESKLVAAPLSPKKDGTGPDGANPGDKTENLEPRTKNLEPKTENQIQTPSAAAAAVATPSKAPRPRDPLFDAVAEVAGVDPATAGGLVAKVCKALKLADPPYTPDDVRRFGNEYGIHCPWGPKDGRMQPTPNEIQTHIGKIRSPPVATSTKPPPASFAARKAEEADSVLRSAIGAGPGQIGARIGAPLAIEEAT